MKRMNGWMAAGLAVVLGTGLAGAQAMGTATAAATKTGQTSGPVTESTRYRLTYTITEIDGGKRVGTEHVAMIVVSGGRTTLKQGSKIPVATGSYASSKGGVEPSAPGVGVETQFTYLDVGLNLDSMLDETAEGVRLRSKIEESSLAEEKSAFFPEPIVRQTVMEGTSFLRMGKPLMLGSLDVPGTTRHLDIEAMVELAR